MTTGAPRVLVVDDEAGMRRMLAIALGMAGFTTELAASGAQALHKLEEFRPDVLLLDLEMPSMGGEEVCCSLRKHADPMLAQCGVILMSGRLDDEATLLRRCAADRLVTKPFQIQALQAGVQQLYGAVLLRRTPP